jgi:long-chain acyl-CoA synthetase
MSGDIGKFDDEGNLLITDRKKDLLITSGGKNVAPQKIECLFVSDPLFTRFVVIGEKKKYLTALCNIDLNLAAMIADEEKIPFQKPVDLLDNDRFLAIVKKHVEERNTHLAKYETIKDYRIIKAEFSQEGGELTATLKLKRKVVNQKYQDFIAQMYEKEAVDELYGNKQSRA